MEITIIKSTTPIIWLDTSFTINIVRAKLGRLVKPVDKERSERIYDVVHRKTQQGRLICPIGRQRTEYDFGESPQECYGIQESLSMGIRFKDELLIQFTQLAKVLRAHNRKRKHLTLSYRDALDVDSVHSRRTSRPLPPSYNNLFEWQYHALREEKNRIDHMLEKMRQYNVSNGITFADELANAYNNGLRGAANYVIQKRRELVTSRKTRTVESRYQAAINDWYWLWLRILLEPLISCAGGDNEFENFIRSDDYRSVPEAKISATLSAHVLTSKYSVRSGDLGDISQLSIVLPYCNIVLTDKKMRNLIKKYRFDKEFRTRVYSLSDIDDLVNELECL